MVKYSFSILYVLTIAAVISSATAYPQYQKPSEKRLQNVEREIAHDLEDSTNKDDLKSSASYGYGYYGYPFGGLYGGYGGYGGYPYSLHGSYYGGYYPFLGGHGFHGHYF